MDLRKLRYFVGVAETGGFRRAAEALCIAQPALSRHIRELETELNFKLFERGNLGVRLTEEGRILLFESKEILERIDSLIDTVRYRSQCLHSTVKLGAPSSIAEILFGPLTERLHETNPNLRVVFSGYRARFLESIENNEIDLAITTSVSDEEIGTAWNSNKLVREQSFLVGRIEQMKGLDRVCLDDVIHLPLILKPMPNSRHSYLQRFARTRGHTLDVVAEAESLSAQISLVRRGFGFAVYSYTAARLMMETGHLAMAPIDDAWSWRILVSRADRFPTTAASIVNETITAIFSELVADGVFSAKATERHH